MQGPGLATNLSEIPAIKGLDNLRVGVRDSRPAIFAVPLFPKEWGGTGEPVLSCQHFLYPQDCLQG